MTKKMAERAEKQWSHLIPWVFGDLKGYHSAEIAREGTQEIIMLKGILSIQPKHPPPYRLLVESDSFSPSRSSESVKSYTEELRWLIMGACSLLQNWNHTHTPYPGVVSNVPVAVFVVCSSGSFPRMDNPVSNRTPQRVPNSHHENDQNQEVSQPPPLSSNNPRRRKISWKTSAHTLRHTTSRNPTLEIIGSLVSKLLTWTTKNKILLTNLAVEIPVPLQSQISVHHHKRFKAIKLLKTVSPINHIFRE